MEICQWEGDRTKELQPVTRTRSSPNQPQAERKIKILVEADFFKKELGQGDEGEERIKGNGDASKARGKPDSG